MYDQFETTSHQAFDTSRSRIPIRLKFPNFYTRICSFYSTGRVQQAHFKIANVLAEFVENKLDEEAGKATQSHGGGGGLRGRLDQWRKRAVLSKSWLWRRGCFQRYARLFDPLYGTRRSCSNQPVSQSAKEHGEIYWQILVLKISLPDNPPSNLSFAAYATIRGETYVTWGSSTWASFTLKRFPWRICFICACGRKN